jgi:hypothetical protein
MYHALSDSSAHRILEVENAEAGDLAPPRQPEQVRRMVVAQHPGRRSVDRRLQQLPPQAAERVALDIGQRSAEPRQEPVEQQLRLDQEGAHVVIGNAVLDMRRDRQRVGKLQRVQRKQCIDRGLVALLDRGRRLAAHHALVAQVLDDQETLVEIGVVDDRGREAALAQPVRDRCERHDVVGKMRDRAVGLPVPHRRAIGPAWRVHQNHMLVAERQPLV